MAADTIVTAAVLFKDVFIGEVRDQLNSGYNIYATVEKRTRSGGNAQGTTPQRYVHFPLRTGRNSAGGFMTPEGILPTAIAQTFDEGKYSPTFMYHPFKVSEAFLKLAKDNTAAFIQGTRKLFEENTSDIMDKYERIIMGDGSGTLGVVNATPTIANTIVLNCRTDARKFSVGQRLNVWSARTAGATQHSFSTASGKLNTVTAVDIDTGTLTLSDDVVAEDNIVTGDVLTQGNDQATTGSNYNMARTDTVGYEPEGLDGIVSDRDPPMRTGVTYGGLYGVLSPKDYGGSANANGRSYWRSYVGRNGTAYNTNTGRKLTDKLLNDSIDAVRILAGGGMEPDCFIASYGLRWEYVDTKQGSRRTVNTMKISGETGGGYTENEKTETYTEFMGKPIIPTRYAPCTTDGTNLTASILAVNLSRLWIDEWAQLDFMQADGSIFKWAPDRTPMYEAIMVHPWNTVTDQRNAHSKIVDVLATDPV
jgi:hypothetical protein